MLRGWFSKKGPDYRQIRKRYARPKSGSFCTVWMFYRIELEMQNEELRQAQVELSAARERCFDLHDLAPVGYCTLSKTGLVLEANLCLPRRTRRRQVGKQKSGETHSGVLDGLD